MTRSGCPIEDVQKDPNSLKYHAQVKAFLQAERLEHHPAYAKLQERTLQESGLLDEDPETIFEMKKLFADYIQSKSK